MSNSLVDYLPYLLDGFLVTLLVFALGTVVWIPAGFILAAGRMSRFGPVRLAAGFVIETFRGSSALVQLFWAFYVLPMAGIELSPIMTAILVLGLNQGSYAAEIVRGAITAVPKGQRNASTVLGLSRWQQYRYVIFPQAFLTMIPAFGNTAITFLKFTSLVSLVTVSDLTLRAGHVQTALGQTLSVFGIALVLYFLVSLVIAHSTRALERTLRRRYTGESRSTLSLGRPARSARVGSGAL